MSLASSKKLELIMESAFVPEALSLLKRHGVSGYTVIPTAQGSGHGGARGEADLIDVFHNVLVWVILSEAVLAQLLPELKRFIQEISAVFCVSDVHVWRESHF